MILPFSHESELGLIGCCLLGGLDASIEAVEAVPPAAFFNEDCKAAFAVIETLATEGVHFDTLGFRRAWQKHYGKRILPAEILRSPDVVPNPLMVDYYAKPVVEAYRRRKLIYSASDLLAKAEKPQIAVDALIAEFEAALSGEDIASVQAFDPKGCANLLTDHLEQRHKLQGSRSGIVTGLYDLDDLTDGLQPGEQTIIAARPSIGKTAIALNILERVCLRDKVPTLFVSCEMSTAALMRRLLSSFHSVGMRTLRKGSYCDEDFKKFTLFTQLLRNSPIHVVDAVGGIDSNRLSACVRRITRKHGIKLVIVDYLQKVRPAARHEKRTYEVAEVSGTLKSLAVQTKTAFLTLAQLNRESEKDKGRLPKLSDLADSGQIERDADTVGLLHRDRGGENSAKACLIIAKQRDGETGTVHLHFDGAHCRFQSASHEH